MTSDNNRPPAGVWLAPAALPLCGIGLLGVAYLVLLIVHGACRAAAQRWADVPPAGAATLEALILAAARGSLQPLIGDGGDRITFWLTIAVLNLLLFTTVATVVGWALLRQAAFGTPAASLAGLRELRDMHGRGAQQRARQLRPALAARLAAAQSAAPATPAAKLAGHRRSAPALPAQEFGLRLGRLRRRPVYASWEDVLLVLAGPRSNKTSALVVPAAITAIGPLIVTSNKVDAYILTVGLRHWAGRVFVLDPQRIAGATQTWWWNPLRGIRDMADAHHLVQHFSATAGAGHERADPYFTYGAERLIMQLVVAAARAGDRSLRDVRRWLGTRSEEPVGLLRAAGLDDLAAALQGTLEAPGDQRGGLFETALTMLRCLESESVARYVTPPHTWVEPPSGPIEEFDPWRFLVGYHSDASGAPCAHDTLYLLTREGAGTAAPVVAAMVDHTLRTAAAAATARGGRTEPPVRAVLDEAANICPIKNLPDVYSYFGSMSVQVITVIQNFQQGVAVWGRAGMDKLWSAATVKLIGAGVHDADFAEKLSRLIGEHEVPTWSLQHGHRNHSTTWSTREKRILSAAAVAALTKTKAILIAAGRRPGQLQLQPWYQERMAENIRSYAAAAEAEVRAAAIRALGPDNPLAQQLTRETNERRFARERPSGRPERRRRWRLRRRRARS